MKVSIEQLVVTSENPRHTPAGEKAHLALVASLGAHGLIQPIVVRAIPDNDNHFEVIAGTRRLEAVKALGWTEVEVVENDAEYGVGELGAAENMMREAMHPLDEANVIARLVADGESIEAVGGRFGQTQKWVEQRIKLIELCPEVQDAFREGLIGMAAAQAYTLVDHKAQRHHCGKFTKDHQVRAESIMAAFTTASYDAKNALFALSEYPQTAIVRDLFGDKTWLEDRKAFTTMQTASINKIKEMLLKDEGWGDVVILWEGPDYGITNKYVKAEGRVLKADRSKHVVLVVYHPRSGYCSFDRGYVLRKDAAKIKVGATPDQDTTTAEAVAAKTADELSPTQLQMIGAFQTAAIETAIADGNVYLALLTLAAPLLSHGHTERQPVWCGGRLHNIGYDNVNTMLTDKIETQDDVDATYKVPSLKDLGDMTVSEIAPLLCNIALRSMTLIPGPDKQTVKLLKAAGQPWMRFDEGFLKRYRLDALQDLAARLKVDSTDLKKGELVAKVLEACTEDRDLSRIIRLEPAKPEPLQPSTDEAQSSDTAESESESESA